MNSPFVVAEQITVQWLGCLAEPPGVVEDCGRNAPWKTPLVLGDLGSIVSPNLAWLMSHFMGYFMGTQLGICCEL